MITTEALSKGDADSWLQFLGPNEAVTTAAAMLVGQAVELAPPDAFKKLKRICPEAPWPADVAAYRTKRIDPSNILEPRPCEGAADNYAGALAFFGATLGTDLDFPNTSRQQIFGTGSVPQQQLRYGILRAIIEHHDRELPMTELIDLQNQNRTDGRWTYHQVYAAASRLREQGLVTLGAPKRNVVAEIQDPTYRGMRPLGPLGSAVYEALDQFWQEGVRRFEYADLERKVLASNPRIDARKLRHRWADMLGKDTIFSSLRRIEASDSGADQSQSIVALGEKHRSGVKTLIWRMHGIQHDRSEVLAQRERARDILGDWQSLATLFVKAKQFSSHHARTLPAQERMGDRILHVIQSGERLSTTEVQNRLAAEGQAMTAMAISNRMLALVRAGILFREKERGANDKYSYHYRLADEGPGPEATT